MVAAVGVKGLLECAQAGAAAKLGVEQAEQQVLAAEAFAVFVGLVCADMAGLMICWKRLMLYMVAVPMFLS